MKNRTGLVVFGTVAFLLAGPAQAEGIGVGVKVGSQGIGAELGYGFNEYLSARLGYNTYTRSESQEVDDIDYDVDAALQSSSLMLDWHPFAGTFRVSLGYVNNSTEFDLEATPANAVEIGGTIYQPADIGKVNASVKFGSGPYFGIGWGNVPAEGFGFTFEIGAFALPDADVSVAVTDPNGVINEADIRQEEQNVKDDLADADYYPVISLGVSYGF